MKKILIIVGLMIGFVSYSQDKKVKVEQEGDLFEVTFYHDNGEVSQTGYITADKKLQGTWKSFDLKGEKKALGHYDNGKKTGTWFFWNANNNQAYTQVDFGTDYRVAKIYEVKQTSQFAENDSDE
ncbi:nicotinic acid mononucleotide adenyltransferase [Wenyingzhuangia sp. 2_MG-2023]|uniref:nicotinic acid mononucleotide adenyltransferase n=1 Tax=Wenyingzhuangia sp. 2_MG-2023 TaxID=3062639 RepID=UPI0026E13267|nr:nicotinic acid mononucleotide adenyltransferase [Wenyingzhuangia sp. 2_MG-2023]MDO6737292.1 nicotinic acid mononucleotide adenyltransferase [Wenyingzhuangia sp. 2_MG-2023]MDO6801628.1 nicotinic acid mononucleotide adenyltransferase [Wenyingzhuangia sp. 1_MG-2023]